ncbi:MAG: DUF975 family protein [Paludibacteraceae bacterium]|nr:DUF975 family protein [Paludibacteraceae bacterium]
MRSNSEYRAMARETLADCWSEYALVALVVSIIPIAFRVPETIGKVLSIGWLENWGRGLGLLEIIFLTIPLGCTFQNMLLSEVRKEEAKEGYLMSLIHGFAANWDKYVIGGLLMMLIFMLVGPLTLCVGLIVLAMAYEMFQFVVKDNPDLSAIDALRRSRMIMRGHKWQLFVLCLSFIGWGLLCILTFFIGFLWLTPYINTSIAHFYEDVKAEYELKLANGEVE